MELVDLYQTIVSLSGFSVPDGLDGRDLTSVMVNGDLASRAFTQFPRPAYYKGEPEVMGYSMRTDRYRLTEWRTFGTEEVIAMELYDHRNDPGETKNIAQSEQGIAVREKLQPLWKIQK